MIHQVYLIHIREFLESNKDIYKIGRTTQEGEKRFKSYPKGSQVLFLKECFDSVFIEKMIMKKFKEKYEQQNQYGREYFKGNKNFMIQDIQEILGCTFFSDTIFTNDEFKIESYDIVKKNFELKISKLNHPVSFIEMDYKDYFSVISETKLIKKYKDIKYKKIINYKGINIEKVYSFINKWLEDPSKRVYEKLDFYPLNIKYDKRIFNIFTGFKGDELLYEFIEINESTLNEYIHFDVNEKGEKIYKYKDYGILNEYIFNLCERDIKKQDIFIGYLANIIQNKFLSKKAFVLNTKESVNIHHFLDFFSKLILGEKYYSFIDKLDSSDSVFINKLLVVLKEEYIDDCRIKSKIRSNKKITVETKEGIFEMNHFMNLIFLINHDYDFIKKDNTYIYINCYDKGFEDKSIDYKNIFDETERREKLAKIFYLLLKNYDLSSYLDI